MGEFCLAGLDLSLSSTGLARWDPAEFPEPITETITPGFRLPSPITLKAMARRLHHLQQDICGALGLVHLVVIEGYSFASRNGGERLGELGGVIRLSLYGAGIPYIEVPPPTLKKYATGSGSAKKDAVLQEAVHRAGRTFRCNDEADAWWLLQMALAHYGLSHIQMPAVNRTALDKIAWPNLTLEVPA